MKLEREFEILHTEPVSPHTSRWLFGKQPVQGIMPNVKQLPVHDGTLPLCDDLTLADLIKTRDDFQVLDCFNSVYKSLIDNRYILSCIADYNQDIRDMYALSTSSVAVLSYLLHFHPNSVPESRLNNFFKKKVKLWIKETETLKSRGFIEECAEDGSSEICYAVTELAYDAFANNLSFEPARVSKSTDCLNNLKESSFYSILSANWLENFTGSFALPDNQRFKTAAEVLELDKLSSEDQMVFWAMANHFLLHFDDSYKIEKRSPYYDDDANENLFKENSIKDSLGRLVLCGLVIVSANENESVMEEEYVLSPKAASILFHGNESIIRYDSLAKYASVIKHHDIDKKELFFSAEAQSDFNNMRKMLSREGFAEVKEKLVKKNRPPCIQTLFWGPPGTGKTETAKQLALESGRDIILFDTSKVTFYGWGSTEKAYRALFRAYNYIAVISENVPILLLNEADDILSKRITHIERAIDKSENTISNILLQEMENFCGILVATTNLIDNLDSAFDRRFLFKTQLLRPDARARTMIWMSNVPELSVSEAEELAGMFDMSGAQINNVAVKRDLAELFYDGDRGFAYIVKLCEEEMKRGRKTSSSHSRIGFSVSTNSL